MLSRHISPFFCHKENPYVMALVSSLVLHPQFLCSTIHSFELIHYSFSEKALSNLSESLSSLAFLPSPIWRKC